MKKEDGLLTHNCSSSSGFLWIYTTLLFSPPLSLSLSFTFLGTSSGLWDLKATGEHVLFCIGSGRFWGRLCRQGTIQMCEFTEHHAKELETVCPFTCHRRCCFSWPLHNYPCKSKWEGQPAERFSFFLYKLYFLHSRHYLPSEYLCA